MAGNDDRHGVRTDRLADGARVSASYGTAFKAPTFNDLYYQDPWGSNGNPNLKPEDANKIMDWVLSLK